MKTGEKPTVKKAKRKTRQRGFCRWASSLQSEVDNPQITIYGEAKVAIKTGGQEP